MKKVCFSKSSILLLGWASLHLVAPIVNAAKTTLGSHQTCQSLLIAGEVPAKLQSEVKTLSSAKSSPKQLTKAFENIVKIAQSNPDLKGITISILQSAQIKLSLGLDIDFEELIFSLLKDDPDTAVDHLDFILTFIREEIRYASSESPDDLLTGYIKLLFDILDNQSPEKIKERVGLFRNHQSFVAGVQYGAVLAKATASLRRLKDNFQEAIWQLGVYSPDQLDLTDSVRLDLENVLLLYDIANELSPYDPTSSGLIAFSENAGYLKSAITTLEYIKRGSILQSGIDQEGIKESGGAEVLKSIQAILAEVRLQSRLNPSSDLMVKTKALVDEIEREIFRGAPTSARLPQLSVRTLKLSAQAQKFADSLGESKRIDALTVLRSVDRTVLFKRDLFSQIPLEAELIDPQSWITIAPPSQAQHAIENYLTLNAGQLDAAKSVISRWLKNLAGFSLRELFNDSELYKYYADEILLAVTKANAERAATKEVKDKFSVRYYRRVLADMNLGNHCGDCTAVGRVNFGRSLTWYYNPFYQIVTLHGPSGLLGKMHLALTDVNGTASILIDAIEFTPMAKPDQPYYEEAKLALSYGIDFAKNLATKQKRSLVALLRSNSTEANSLIQQQGVQIHRPQTPLFVRFSFDAKSIANVLAIPNQAILQTLEPWYQSLDFIVESNDVFDLQPGVAVQAKAKPEPVDLVLPELENEVVNPAQDLFPHLGQLLDSSRNQSNVLNQMNTLEEAANVILGNAQFKDRIMELYHIPKQYGVSPKFLANKLAKLFPTTNLKERSLSNAYPLKSDSFVILTR